MTTTLAAPNRNRNVGLILVLGALTALGPFTIDMYLPALPTLGNELAAAPATIQLTLTGTLVGLALGQLVIGPLSDSIGRRKPLLVGLALHVAASVLCVFAPNVAILGTLRVLQGVGAAAGAVIAMAVVRDLFTGRRAATLMSRLMLVLGASPVLAPSIGGELLRLASWRGVFAVLAVFSLVMMFVVGATLPETLPAERRRSAGVGSVARTIGQLARDRVFVGLVLVASLATSAIFSYVSGSSFVFQEHFQLDEQQFGLVFGMAAVFLIAATQLNAWLVGRYEPRKLIVLALVAATIAALAQVAAAESGAGLVGFVGALLVTLFTLGLAMPNGPALAMSLHGEAAGTAAAVLGAVQFAVGALVAPLVGALGNDAVAMSITMASGLLVGLAVLVVVVRPWQLADLEPAEPEAEAAAA